MIIEVIVEAIIKFKKTLYLLAGAALLLLAGSWLYANSFLTVSVSNGGGKPLTYTIVNQSNNSTVTIKTNKTTLTRMVPRGEYQVSVTSDRPSGFIGIATAKGFLRTTTLKAGLSLENDRQFVGNNPKPCVVYAFDTLLSVGCSSPIKEALVHVPATASLPTYVTKLPANNPSGITEGEIYTADGVFVLLQTDQGQRLFKLEKDFRLSGGKIINGLNGSSLYSIALYQKGFVVYSLTAAQVITYASADAPGKTLDLGRQHPKNTSLVDVTPNDLGLVATYSPLGTSDYYSSTSSIKGSSEFVIFQGAGRRSITVNQPYSQAELCGRELLCAISPTKGLEVYDTSNNQTKRLYGVAGVNHIISTNGDWTVSTDQGIIRFNPVNKTGYYIYTYGDYKPCGINNTPSGIVACVSDSKNNTSALLINPSQPNASNIDKKVAQLVKLSYVSAVSAYKNFIYITPNLGNLQYNQATNLFDYDPTIKRVVGEAINKSVTDLGIDTKTYQVINTAP